MAAGGSTENLTKSKHAVTAIRGWTVPPAPWLLMADRHCVPRLRYVLSDLCRDPPSPETL